MKPLHRRMAVLLVTALMLGCWAAPSTGRSGEAPSTPAPAAHPFGILLGGRDIEAKIRTAKALGARYYRTTNALFIDSWTGRDPECDAAIAAGLELVLTVRAGSGPPLRPSRPPEDIEAYKRILGEILDRYRPALLVVENEENSAALFYDGTPKAYHRELRAACEVAHARGIKAANGGLVSTLVAGLVADHYEKSRDAARAEDFLRRTLDENLRRQLRRKDRRVVEQLEKGRALLAGYKAAGADYVNFHWYIADTPALIEAVTFLKEATGLPVLSNEVGQQKNEDPGQVTSVMTTIRDLGLPIAIWYSVDVPGFGGARGLVDSGYRLRPNGEAFRKFLRDNYRARPASAFFPESQRRSAQFVIVDRLVLPYSAEIHDPQLPSDTVRAVVTR